MIITILKRYDINGAWTHDFSAEVGDKEFKPAPNSMWRVSEVIDLKEIKETQEYLELELEDLTEQNRKLVVRVQELIKELKAKTNENGK